MCGRTARVATTAVAADADQCQTLCRKEDACAFWTFYGGREARCELKDEKGPCGIFPAVGEETSSGPKECKHGWVWFLILSGFIT